MKRVFFIWTFLISPRYSERVTLGSKFRWPCVLGGVLFVVPNMDALTVLQSDDMV